MSLMDLSLNFQQTVLRICVFMIEYLYFCNPFLDVLPYINYLYQGTILVQKIIKKSHLVDSSIMCFLKNNSH